VVEAYRAYRQASGLQRLPNPKPGVGEGKELAALIRTKVDEYDGEPGGKLGPERVCRLLDWLANSQHDKAKFYRSKAFPAVTVRRHVGDLWALCIASPSPAKTGPNVSLCVDPWSIVETEAKATSFNWPVFVERLPPNDRDRIVESLRASGSWAEFRQSKHPLDIERCRQAFNRAYEARG